MVDYLCGEKAHKLHKPARGHHQRKHIYVGDIYALWQEDLANMQVLAHQNNGMRYLLTIIDVLSTFFWVEPVTIKDEPAITAAFCKVLYYAEPRRPRRPQTNKNKHILTPCLPL